ncbi:MAG: hypothetical protein M1820_006028 [Bogoriella megaspora]|nr:MAG: hypothetical protein M1820_006028 [Bogoriella megaspora]
MTTTLNRLARLPPAVSRWLGYRASPPPPLPQYLIYIWSFLGAFCGLTTVQVIFDYSSYFQARHVPVIVASYGASAVLIYGTPELPLAQPRALVGGHFLSALVGVCITKLFSLMPSSSRFESLRWLSASLSTAVAIVVMQITKTVHPPAGASALLPAIDDQIWNLSWYYLPIVLLSSALILAVGLVVNNIQRRYPVFWIAADAPKPASAPSKSESSDLEANSSSTSD